MRTWLAFALAWALILGGAFLAHRVQTSNGTVTVSEVRIPAEAGVTVSGLLYTPVGATAARPAPGVLVSHGYINTREMQSPFAIELSRRGFVVLAMDMTGHGYSGGIVGTAGFGGPAALRYLKGLPVVDKGQIGLEGHSMGGGPILAAAAEDPDGYRSLVLEGSAPGLLGAKAPANIRNLAIVFGQYDEFAGLMWQVPKGSEVADSKRLQAIFGVTGRVQTDRVYGSVADGTARILANPPVTHPWEHFSNAGVGDAIDWFQRTLPTPAAKPPASQVWLWKEVGTLTSFIGMVGLILATFDLLLRLPAFARLSQPAQPLTTRRDGRWWLSLAITAALPALTYFPLMKVGQVFFPMAPFPQWIQNQLLVWALGTAVITLLIGLVLRRRAAFTTRWGLSIAVAVVTMAVAYGSLALVDALFKVDYRFWVLGLKPLDATRAMQVPGYLILWSLFFLVAMRSFAASIPVRGEGLIAAMAWGKVAMALGFGVLVIWEYATLFATGLLATPTEPLNVIVAIQFVPLLGVIGIIGAWTYRRTNSYVPGALICALLISWYVTSGTANHWQPGFAPQLPGAAAKR
ncbi:MAG: alpha/beta fold hydrolase [Alphaproteobacteria bacterium]|nr:alpha/beta fold hydrolase [Alphaproteobacteria bacterium]MBU1515454.1 alpha/beta fold hydrolase [Alphaproteobacteria bacterium]MBU2095452.1 alpha/beta fold hydrolase [Alphaproteobacteria bacterium]MBU2150694.1 alpha/beta fold hydrolase [Alphaproteobacteria bacterium]MBU2306958.1 alpha/beta fold hydrolase [Alphaproteobacteria bacterium]